MFRCLAVVGVRQVVFPRVECSQRVASGVMQVEVANHHCWESVIWNKSGGVIVRKGAHLRGRL